MSVQQLAGKQAVTTIRPSPTIVIGIGDFARQVLSALAMAARRPGLANTHLLWAGPEGWATPGEDGQIARPANGNGRQGETEVVESWQQEHGTAGHERIQQLVERAQAEAGRAEQTLDLYLVGHLQEATVRALWPAVLAVARAANIPFSDHIFTLIFATDSRTFTGMAPAEAAGLHEGLEAVATVLEAATDSRELPGRVGWCYFVDSVDVYGRPLQPLALAETAAADGDPARLQAHMIAEFISMAAAGLRRHPDYGRLSLATLQRDRRALDPVARIGTLAAGSALFPVSAIANQARDSLAPRLLADHLLGKDRPGDLPDARKLRERWLAEHTLNPHGLRRELSQDEGGHPISFPVEMPEVRLVYDDDPERLPDLLRNWDQILSQRWTATEGLPAQMEERAQALQAEAAAWVDEELEELVAQEVGGMRRAAHFLREAEVALQNERGQPEQGAEESGWLTLLLSSVRRRPDPTALPDLKAGYRCLETALARRMNRRAVWVRASVVALTLLSFAWAAYLAAGGELGLQGLVASRLRISGGTEIARVLDWVALGVGCWLIALLFAWATIYRSESAVIGAAEWLSDGLRQKYAALMERTLRAQREGVYGGLLAHLAGWRQAIISAQETMSAAVATLTEALEGAAPELLLLSEQLLLAENRWSELLPAADPVAEADLAARFAVDERRPLWCVATIEEWVDALRASAREHLAVWQAQLARRGRLGQEAPDQALARLREGLQPAWPLDREERMAVARQATADLNGDGDDTPHAVTFVGLPPGGEAPDVEGEDGRVAFFGNGEPGRLAYVPTIHGLCLRSLRLWETLPQPAEAEELSDESTETPANESRPAVAPAGE